MDYGAKHKLHYNKVWLHQCDPVEGMEGEEASLCLKSNKDCAVFALQERLFQSIAPLYLRSFPSIALCIPTAHNFTRD